MRAIDFWLGDLRANASRPGRRRHSAVATPAARWVSSACCDRLGASRARPCKRWLGPPKVGTGVPKVELPEAARCFGGGGIQRNRTNSTLIQRRGSQMVRSTQERLPNRDHARADGAGPSRAGCRAALRIRHLDLLRRRATIAEAVAEVHGKTGLQHARTARLTSRGIRYATLAASLAIAAGANVKVVQTMLGRFGVRPAGLEPATS